MSLATHKKDELSEAKNVPSENSILPHSNHNMATAGEEESHEAGPKKLVVAQSTTATQSYSHSFRSDKRIKSDTNELTLSQQKRTFLFEKLTQSGDLGWWKVWRGIHDRLRLQLFEKVIHRRGGDLSTKEVHSKKGGRERGNCRENTENGCNGESEQTKKIKS